METHAHLGAFCLFRGVNMPKEFKTIDQQLSILKSRGLKVEDEDKAKEFLLNHNYYRISGYSLTLRKDDVFYDTATFQNIIDIYEFDRKLRAILLQFIEIIEVEFKSVYTYYFVKEYGPLGYLNSTNFSKATEYLKTMSKVQKQKERRLQQEAFLQHFVNDLKEDVPFWALVELMSISDISRFYTITDCKIRIEVAEHFGFKHTDAAITMEKYMHCMTILRNLCAHGSRLYNRLFITKPSLSSKEKKLLRVDENGHLENNRLFGYVLNMKRLLNEYDFSLMKKKIVALNKEYTFVAMNRYGFCDNWQKLV